MAGINYKQKKGKVNPMKKRILGTILAATLVVAQAVSIFAAGSKTAAPTPVGDSAGKYEVVTSDSDAIADIKPGEDLTPEQKEEMIVEEKKVFAVLEKDLPKVLETIVNMNIGDTKLADMLETMNDLVKEADDMDEKDANLTPEQKEARKQERKEAAEKVKEEMKGKELVTKVFDLKPIDGGIKDEEGNYVATLSIPVLTEQLKNKDVKLLHFSTERGLWEVIDPEDVDFEEKTITAKFKDLSPVAVVADELTEEEKAAADAEIKAAQEAKDAEKKAE